MSPLTVNTLHGKKEQSHEIHLAFIDIYGQNARFLKISVAPPNLQNVYTIFAVIDLHNIVDGVYLAKVPASSMVSRVPEISSTTGSGLPLAGRICRLYAMPQNTPSHRRTPESKPQPLL